MGFAGFNFDPIIGRALTSQGFSAPTPIQEKAIPEIIKGRDVLGLAQTGTGKTAAFVLPIIQRFIERPQSGLNTLAGLNTLIVAPTRELSEQILTVLKEFSKGTQIRCTAIYGGVSMSGQQHRLRQGVNVIVACPGRLLDHLERRTINLSNIDLFILDEADMMFNMGFLPSLREIVRYLPKARQTLLFSATMPKEIARLVGDVQKNPVRVEVDIVKPLSTVTHAFYPVEQAKKNALLVSLLGTLSTESVLVFTRTKHRAKRLADHLARSNFRATSLQGNLSQNRRQAALNGFRQGRFQILVATDIASRGIDISSITHVINYDVPDTVEAYTHRIGRTGRAAREGDAFTLITSEDREIVRSIERSMQTQIERRSVEGLTDLGQESAIPRGSQGGPRGGQGGGGRSNAERPFSDHQRRPGNRSQRRPRWQQHATARRHRDGNPGNRVNA